MTSGRAPRARASGATRPDPGLIADLVAANRILAEHGVLDGWGHVSARIPDNPGRYLLACARAPELVRATDLMEYGLDGVPFADRGRNQYTERWIHAAIYRSRPDVMAIVHSHAAPLIPFGVSSVPLRPVYHRAAFLAQGVPVFEIREAAGMTDLLIRTPELGDALAARLADRPAVLMRGHGVTVVGPSIPRLVGRAIFMTLNATLQQQALALGGTVTWLDQREASLIEAREGYGLARAWEAWKRRASRGGR